MFEYDTALKLLLKETANRITRKLSGGAVIQKWINVELPAQNTRVDLLGETDGGALIEIELQSSNDPSMPLRMAEYCLRILRLHHRFPAQVVLYVGEEPMRMENELRGPRQSFGYDLVDIRSYDGEWLLESDAVGDNIVAILGRVHDTREAGAAGSWEDSWFGNGHRPRECTSASAGAGGFEALG